MIKNCACDADRAAIESLVQQILDLKAADPTADVSKLEAEIDIAIESHGGLPGAFDTNRADGSSPR